MALASDLASDLKTPFQPMTNPFGSVTQKIELEANTAAYLKSLLQKCAYVASEMPPSGMAIVHDAALNPSCISEISVSYDTGNDGTQYISNKMLIHSQGLSLYVVSWDGSDSDGGDEQALAIYDMSGKRLAVYPSLFVDGNVLDGLSHALGINLPEVKK